MEVADISLGDALPVINDTGIHGASGIREDSVDLSVFC